MVRDFQRISNVSMEPETQLGKTITVPTTGIEALVTNPLTDRMGIMIHNTDGTNIIYYDLCQGSNTIVPSATAKLGKIAAGATETIYARPGVRVWLASSTSTISAYVREFN